MMGLDPRAIGRLRIWEFNAMAQGFAEAHGGGNETPSDESFLAALAAEKRRESPGAALTVAG